MKNAVLMILLVLPLLVVQLRADTDKSNDVVHIGKSISVAPNETVGDAVCVGCSIRMNGRATGDLVAVGGGIQVEGNVQGDVVAVAGHLRLGSNAFVHGDAVAVGGTLQRDPGSRVNGTVTNPRTPMMAGVGGMAMLLLVPFLGALAAGIVLSILCWLILGQARIETIVATLRAQTALALLAGLGVIVGFVVLVIALHWTGPASPFIIGVLCLLLFLLAVVGYTGVSAWIGEGVS